MLKKLALTIAVSLFAAPVFASPITGMVSINGSDTYTDSTINFLGAGGIGGVSTGTLSNFGDCIGCVTMSSFNYTTAGFTNPTDVFTATEDGNTFSLALTSILDSGIDSLGNLTIRGLGLLSETGFDDTSGTFQLTSQNGNAGKNAVTFSATTVGSAISSVPEPGTLLLFATGMMGLGYLGLRKVKSRDFIV